MKDQFDLKKFLTENKTIENSNPFLKEEKEEKKLSKKEEKSLEKISKQLKKSVKAHGVQAKTIDKALKEESREERADVDKYEYEKGKKAGEKLKSKIREMIINELSEDVELEEVDTKKLDDKIQKDPKLLDKVKAATEKAEKGDSTDLAMLMAMPLEETNLDEAKEDEEEVEEEETEDEGEAEEEISAEEETEEKPETGGGLEDIAADMEGNEGDLMDNLISALKISKAMDNEKLTTQIGNTLKFFVGEYIGGEE